MSKQEQAEPGITLSSFLKEKDSYFWKTEIENGYRQKLGTDQLVAAIEKLDLAAAGETFTIGKAKKRLTAWLDRWLDEMHNQKPRVNRPRGERFELAQYYTNLVYPDRNGDHESHEAASESYRTPFGHRIVIDIPDLPFRNMVAMIGWDKMDQQYHVYVIEAGHDLSADYLDVSSYFDGINKAAEPMKEELKEQYGEGKYKAARPHLDALTELLGENNSVIQELEHEVLVVTEHEKELC